MTPHAAVIAAKFTVHIVIKYPPLAVTKANLNHTYPAWYSGIYLFPHLSNTPLRMPQMNDCLTRPEV